MENYLQGNLYQNTADFYDFDNRDIIKDDLPFYIEYVNQTQGSILELASGTGRVSLPIAEKTQRHIECIELSVDMLDNFKNKLKSTHKHLEKYITLHNMDMSNFNLGNKFEIIIIPWRALQWLPIQEKTISCLECVNKHLTDNGIFIFDIFKPRVYDEKWIGKEDLSYDIKCDSKRIIRSTVNHFADTKKKYIQYKNKIRVLDNGAETIKEDMLTIKYYEYNDIVNILNMLNFNVREEYGYYDKRSLNDGEEMIFVCTKK